MGNGSRKLSRQCRGRRKKLSEVLLYALEQGPTEATILKQCERMGREIPAAIQNKPWLMPGLELFYVAFRDLHTCRGGMGDGPIPWTAIEQYCDALVVEGDQRRRLHLNVRAMDNTFLEHHRKQADAKRKG